MPPGAADSGDDGDDTASETDSLEIVSADDFILSEEDKQGVIDRVTFVWCRTVREAGERYRDGEKIPVIAVELGVPMMEARKAVKTYYLVFAEPPVYDVRKHVFDNGRRYFQDGVDVEELDAETRTEAEEHVRAFVGRTLLEHEPDDVDIEEPVPGIRPRYTTGSGEPTRRGDIQRARSGALD